MTVPVCHVKINVYEQTGSATVCMKGTIHDAEWFCGKIAIRYNIYGYNSNIMFKIAS